MKKLITNRKTTLLIIFILLVVILILGVVLFNSSFKFKSYIKNSKTNDFQTAPTIFKLSEEAIAKEEAVEKTIIEAAEAHIKNTFAGASDVISQTEFIGAGYAIFNVNYSVGQEKNVRKVYLKKSGTNWNVIHDSQDKIPCSAVTELQDVNSILFNFCN